MLLKDDNIDNDILYETEDNADDDGDVESNLYEHFRLKVDKGQSSMRVDKYMANMLPGISRNRIQEAADAGHVLANGKSVKCSYKIKPHPLKNCKYQLKTETQTLNYEHTPQYIDSRPYPRSILRKIL